MRRWLNACWGLLAVVAVLWPGRLSGALDGLPLDTVAEATLIGVVLPGLWWFHPAFLETRLGRATIVALIAWKALTAVSLAQDGWCVRFVPARPFAKDAGRAPHSWDVRADWRSPDPACSAIVTRAYRELPEFPAWFFNLPPASFNDPPVEADRPPHAVTRITLTGFFHAPAPGRLQLAAGESMTAAVRVDGQAAPAAGIQGGGVRLASGVHLIEADIAATGDRWRLVPLWNGADMWAGVATVTKPARRDLWLRPWGRWVSPGLIVCLTGAWLVAVAVHLRSRTTMAWTVAASLALGVVAAVSPDAPSTWCAVVLLAAVAAPVPPSLRNLSGAFLLIGVPWLTLIAVATAPLAGRFTLYTAGDDYWMFQRYAYRIFMQGYWLEGGQPTFWFQPFYRWVAGALHLVFGDSSAGERLWDGVCALAMALFAFRATEAFAGFRWGLLASATTLAIVMLASPWVFIGRGLSEITSAGFLSVAAILAASARTWSAAIAAGLFATLGFYTRLNNLPMAFGVASFALPMAEPIRTLWRPRIWWPRVSVVTLAGVSAAVCAGLLAFAWRTWHYTGVFSVSHGTQGAYLSVWQPGLPLGVVLGRMADSLWMVLTMHDPPSVDRYAMPMIAAFAISVIAIVRSPLLGDLPAPLVLFCLSAVSGALVARGSAYAGRFSIHLIGISTAVVVSTVAHLCKTLFTRSTSPSS